MQLTRRTALQGLALASLLGAGVGRSPSFARDSDPRLLLVHLRGGLDALAAVPPLGDPNFARIQGRSISHNGNDAAHKLDRRFALHPALAPLIPFYAAGELLILPGTGIPDANKSHAVAETALFDADLDASELGWPQKIASVVSGGSPDLWQAEPYNPYADGLLDLALATPSLDVARVCANDMCASYDHAIEILLDRKRALNKANFVSSAIAAAEALSEPTGAKVALLHLSGFDTHASQDRRLAATFEILASGIVAFAEVARPIWPRTVVLAITEFGRSVCLNEYGGTDHGNASVTLLMGGPVAGGRVDTGWSGLELADGGRDLPITQNVHSIVKAVLTHHLCVSGQNLAAAAPRISAVPAAKGLFKYTSHSVG